MYALTNGHLDHERVSTFICQVVITEGTIHMPALSARMLLQ